MAQLSVTPGKIENWDTLHERHTCVCGRIYTLHGKPKHEASENDIMIVPMIKLKLHNFDERVKRALKEQNPLIELAKQTYN